MQESNTHHWKHDACSRCPQFVNSNVVVASPRQPGGFLIIGEAPNLAENLVRAGFVGNKGIYLRALLRNGGMAEEEYGLANICRCQPPNNRRPTRLEIETCLPFLINLIEETRPKVILTAGKAASEILCGPGTLEQMIADRQSSKDWSGRNTKSTFRSILPILNTVPYVVPMPDTTPRVVHNPKWYAAACKQIDKVIELYRG